MPNAMREPQSVGMQSFARFRSKQFPTVLKPLPLRTDPFGLQALAVGESNFYNTKLYSKSDLKLLREKLARLNRAFPCQFHLIKHGIRWEVGRIA